MNWRAEVPAVRRPPLFTLDPGPAGPWQSARCAEEGCTHISWTGPWCELHRHRYESAVPLSPDVAALIGLSNAWARQEDR